MKKTNRMQQYGWKATLAMAGILAVLSVLLSCLLSMIYTAGVSVFNNDYVSVIVIAISVFCLLMTTYAYFYYQSTNDVKTYRNVFIMFTMITVTCVVGLACIRYISPYTVPVAMTAVIVGILISRSLGFIANICSSTIVSVAVGVLYRAGYATDIAFLAPMLGIVVATVEAFCSMYLIKLNYTRFKLIFGSMAIGAVVSLAIMPMVTVISLDYRYILLAYAFSLCGNALAVVGFAVLLPLFEEIFDVWTNFKLAEACSMSRDLLKRLSDEAPGTFNHCIIVSNIAEACAMAIGENPYLAKACGLYHDIGKLNNPEFFVENQSGYNPHDDLIPEHSARLIIAHTNTGYEMLRRARLPETVAIVAKEHHGTTLTGYFYAQAKNVAGGRLDDKNFRYDGPKPSSKISAIVMIADSVEAATRAKNPKNAEELRAVITAIIRGKIDENQFSDCELSFADIDEITESIIKVIPAIFHKRIDYIKENKAE